MNLGGVSHSQVSIGLSTIKRLEARNGIHKQKKSEWNFKNTKSILKMLVPIAVAYLCMK
jgi:hypothetical protein